MEKRFSAGISRVTLSFFSLCLPVWLASTFSLPGQSAATSSPPIRTLIVTGQNSHPWPETSRALKKILEDTGLFVVDLAVSPPRGASMKNFRPNFSTYQLVVLDYSGDAWPSSTEKAFVDFVKKGGGVVVYHASSSAFPDWPAYNEIVGLTGWGGRNEKVGPYVYWKDDRIIQEATPGIAGYHPPPHPFLVINRQPDHPILAGLPRQWMHAEDELYGLMRGPAKNLTVLATAFSSPAQAGTGRHEPVLFTVTYGAGRIFHTTLGHASGDGPFPALECVGFIVTFRRGAEWAATGRVSQAVPPDFPATEKTVSTPADVRRWPSYQPPSLDSLLEALRTFEHSRDEEVVYRLRDYVRAHRGSEEARRVIEAKFLAFLESGVPPAATMEICRHLRLLGSENSATVLGKLLLDPEKSDMARYALEKIPGETVDEVLLGGLSQADGQVKIGIISSLGKRRTEKAVPHLAQLLLDPEVETAAAAVNALGEIGSPEARMALLQVFPGPSRELREGLASSLLRCAEGGDDQITLVEAQTIYDRVLSSDLPPHLRQAGLRGKIRTSEKEQGRRLILEALESPSPEDDEPAIELVGDFFDETSIPPVASYLEKVPEPSRIKLLAVLAQYPGHRVRPAILQAAQSNSLAVRVAALKALQTTADASLVSFLAERAALARGLEQEEARACLWALGGEAVDEVIRFGLLTTAREDVKRELIRAAGVRRIQGQKALLIELTRSGSRAIRQEALRALRHLADRQDLPLLLDLFLQTDEEALAEELMVTIAGLSLRLPDPEDVARLVEERLEPEVGSKRSRPADPLQRARLYALLARLGQDRSLPLLRQGLSEESPIVVDAAVRSLAEWPTPAARFDLLSIARTASSFTHRILATRGFIRMVGLEKYQAPAGAVNSLELILEVVERPDEIKLVLGTLAEFPCAEALELAESYLSVEEVKEEAEAAVQAIKKKLVSLRDSF